MLPWDQILLRLVLASLFGALIGLERERRHWAAGLRTHMMVCVGSSLIMIVSAYGFADVLGTPNVELDPSRVAAQVVSGIGFIGAGVIFFLRRGTIRGLTTAAGLWTVAAIGLATGGGLYFAAAATTIIAFIILWALRPLERQFLGKYGSTTLKIVTDADINNLEVLKRLMKKEHLKVQSFSFEKGSNKFTFFVDVKRAKDFMPDLIIRELKDEDVIKEVSWSK